MTRSLRVETYFSEIYNANLILIGVLHNVDSSQLRQKLDNISYDFDIIFFESGTETSLDPESVNEHKALVEYKKNHNVVLESCDIEKMNNLIKSNINKKDAGFSVDRVKKAVYHNISLDPRAENFHEDTKEELAKMESSFPNIYEFFVVLRNMKMSRELDKALEKYKNVGLVVGCGHLPGIVDRMETI
jgi:uncharacterized protein YbaP (TraB family)